VIPSFIKAATKARGAFYHRYQRLKLVLLDAPETATAYAILRELSSSFHQLDSSTLSDPFLAGGCAGLALMHAALHQVFPESDNEQLAISALDRAVDILGIADSAPALFNGYSGVAWVAEVLCGDPGVSLEDDPNAQVDVALEARLAQSPCEDSFDLLDGLTGMGVYALERAPRPSSRRIVELIVNRLAEMSESQDGGVAWRSRREWIPEKVRPETIPDWNLGVAHGVPGVIALLARITNIEMDTSTAVIARTLLDKSITWLLAQETKEGFPYYVGSGFVPELARLAWCYGDPGISATLVLAGQAAGQRDWEEEGIRVGLRACAGLPETAGVKDGGLCHGAAGLGHIFHRLYRSTQREEFAKASRLWFRQLFAMRRESGSFAGYLSYGPDREGTLGWHEESGFLTGAAGITLALTAAVTETEPVWDRAMMLSA
jgi:hypothetical protein